MKLLVVLPMLLSSAYSWLSECGQSKYADAGTPVAAQYIVGGVESREHEYPFQISLRRTGSHMCGAVLINNGWALTAAHCTDKEQVSRLDVVVGQHRISDTTTPSRVVSALTRYINHEGYDSRSLVNDIALLQFDLWITMNADVQPACQPLTSAYTGDTAVVSGWGAIFSGGPGSDELRYATLPVMSDDECIAIFGNEWLPGMVCAGRSGQNPTDTCQGDSGGPLAVKRNGRFDVVGLTSWGYGCAGETPGVYTRVSYFLDWIASAGSKKY